MRCQGCGQEIRYRRSEDGNEWVHANAAFDLWCEWIKPEKRMDPDHVKVVNWSRKRKRNKKLWKTTRSRRSSADMMSDEEAMMALEGI